MKRIVAIIQPTNSCNLSCRYCYVQKSDSKIMSTKTLENLIKKFALLKQHYDINTHFLWHGGEPLLPGLDFYKEVISLQKRYYQEDHHGFSNSIQTNLTLLDEEFLDFLVLNKIRIGFSLDGPKEINDANRTFKNGDGTFDKIMEKVALMKRKNLKLRAIAVLTKININKLDELYYFFKENSISFKVHSLVYAGNFNVNKDIYISQEEYGQALIKLFDLWFNDKDFRINIEPLYQYLGNLITGNPHECSTLRSCQEKFLSVDPEGDVYPCGRFAGIKELCYGNINTESLESILSSPLRKTLLERISHIYDCLSCKYKQICNGGCMNNAYNAGNILDKDDYCKAYKMVFDYLSSILQKFPQLKELKLRENLDSLFI